MKVKNKILTHIFVILMCLSTANAWKVSKDGIEQMQLTDTGRLWIGADGKYGEPKMAVTTTETTEDRALDVRTERIAGNNYGIVATAVGGGADMNVGLYGYAAGATNNYGLLVDSGYGIFDDRVGIGTREPNSIFHTKGTVNHEDGTIVTIENDTSANWSRTLSVLTPNVTNGNQSGLLTFGQSDSVGAAGHISYVNSDTDGEGYINFSIRSKGANLLTIREDHNVGIGTAAPSQKLEVNGNGLADAWQTNADKRLKTEINPIINALDKISRLKGVTYRWKGTNKSQNLQMGFIAQEVEKIVPEVVNRPRNSDQFYSMQYDKLTALLVESIKELKKQNDTLKALVCQDHPDADICVETNK